MENDIKKLFQDYDVASNKASDCFLQILEAWRTGDEVLANYLETKVYPKLQRKSYQLFLLFSEKIERKDKYEHGKPIKKSEAGI